eukprot:CAMPEP_0117068508 /NCGR_PEP_ID=MMETSP0472-20121206/48018_1 /TAXON_ID=693140 ORGANISM="Tiarina fusus, Strain LIS" /NCGR_SAMPLE_ID=MMETSP0472 /ASSEMBLY_ACC=CAM_ASM_000603 /LENGTH=33 /DNA_ID= /DNA_START= /DNA_END= /DNA_ORIENTATION=
MPPNVGINGSSNGSSNNNNKTASVLFEDNVPKS